MTLDEVLAAYRPRRWKTMEGKDWYDILYATDCLLRGPLAIEHKDQLKNARESALRWLNNKPSRSTKRKAMSNE